MSEELQKAGFTEEEAAAWVLIKNAAEAMFAMPPEHPSEHQDVAFAIHILQRMLMARPTRRLLGDEAPATSFGTSRKQREKQEREQRNLRLLGIGVDLMARMAAEGNRDPWFYAADLADEANIGTRGAGAFLAWARTDDLIEVLPDGKSPQMYRVTDKGQQRIQESEAEAS